jgi:hypothetical protein
MVHRRRGLGVCPSNPQNVADGHVVFAQHKFLGLDIPIHEVLALYSDRLLARPFVAGTPPGIGRPRGTLLLPQTHLTASNDALGQPFRLTRNETANGNSFPATCIVWRADGERTQWSMASDLKRFSSILRLTRRASDG